MVGVVHTRYIVYTCIHFCWNICDLEDLKDLKRSPDLLGNVKLVKVNYGL